MITFGDFKLDPESGEFFENDMLVRLSPLATKALVFMATYEKTFIPREVLANHLWDTKRTDIDAGLNSVILIIRKALGEKNSQFIETVPRRGYRFLPNEKPTGKGYSVTLLQKGLALTAGIAMVLFVIFYIEPFNTSQEDVLESPENSEISLEATAEPITFLVKNAVDGSVDPDFPNFGTGLTADLILGLVRIEFPGLEIYSEGEIVQTEVDYLITSVYRAEGDDIRITLQLVKVTNGEIRWAGNYKIRFDDLEPIRNELIFDLIEALENEVDISF